MGHNRHGQEHCTQQHTVFCPASTDKEKFETTRASMKNSLLCQEKQVSCTPRGNRNVFSFRKQSSSAWLLPESLHDNFVSAWTFGLDFSLNENSDSCQKKRASCAPCGKSNMTKNFSETAQHHVISHEKKFLPRSRLLRARKSWRRDRQKK